MTPAQPGFGGSQMPQVSRPAPGFGGNTASPTGGFGSPPPTGGFGQPPAQNVQFGAPQQGPQGFGAPPPGMYGQQGGMFGPTDMMYRGPQGGMPPGMNPQMTQQQMEQMLRQMYGQIPQQGGGSFGQPQLHQEMYKTPMVQQLDPYTARLMPPSPQGPIPPAVSKRVAGQQQRMPPVNQGLGALALQPGGQFGNR